MSAAARPLQGRRVVVSAGPTYEDIDPVRFLGNRSSGKMGFAIAAAAVEHGAQVALIAGPVHLPTPEAVERIDVRSAAQMHAAVLGALPADIYIGAAAVADFTPATVAPHKIKKSDDGAGLTLQLVRTRDILADVAASVPRPALVVGFAAETQDLARNAQAKRVRKGVDLIAANQVGVAEGGFESDRNALIVYDDAGKHAIGPADKHEVARELLALIERHLGNVTTQ